MLYLYISGGNMNEQNSNEIYELLQVSRDTAIKCLKNFFKLLDLDPDLFSHLYNIPIKITNDTDESMAEYCSDKNLILISECYLQNRVEIMKSDKDKFYRIVIRDVANTIIHEIYHANRDIYINNGKNSINISSKNDNEILKYNQQLHGYDIDQYNLLLNAMLSKSYVDKFSRYIPIKVTINKDNTYTVIAYDCISIDYVEFKNQNFDVVRNGSNDDFILNLGIELNRQINNHEITRTIFSFNGSEDNIISNAADYFSSYDKAESATKTRNTVSIQKYIKELDSKRDYLYDIIEKQVNFEEIIIETLANITVMTMNEQVLDLDSITKKLENSNCETDVKMGAKLIRSMGKDMIRWFILSAYSDYYDNRIYKIFEERYNDLIDDFSDLYLSVISYEDPNNLTINDINNILEQKTPSKK